MAKEIKINGPTKKKSFTSIVSENLSKNGKIKGKNKKDTKRLIDICEHHVENKKHKRKPNISNDGNGICTCRACRQKFPTTVKSKSEVKELTEPLLQLVNQSKFIAVAANLGRNTEEYFVHGATFLRTFPKTYAKAVDVVSKEEKTKKHKKKKNGDRYRSDSAKFGSWS